MCKPFREYLELLREYSREVVTFGGIAAAVWIYSDFKTFLAEQSRILSELSVRIEHIEHRLEK